MSDEWVMAPREASEAMIRAGYSAPTVFGVRDMANTYRAMLAAAPDAPQRNREADRARYIDRAFNEWLDDSVADGGATVWDLVPDIHSAWAAWTAHPHYAAPQQAEPVAWRDHVEQRMHNWRQRKMNRSGDRLALDDMMSKESIDDLIDYVCDEWSDPVAPQQAEPVAWMAFGGSIVHAVTRNAMDPIEAERFDVPLYLHPPAAPQQAEPVEQIGWSDEFGNLFPMGAWKPAQRTHHDSHKTAWRAVYLHAPAAEVQMLRAAARDVCEWADAAQWALGNETGVPAAKLDALRRVLEGGE